MKIIISFLLYKFYKFWNNISWERLNIRRFRSSHLMRTTYNWHSGQTMKTIYNTILSLKNCTQVKQKLNNANNNYNVFTFTELVHKTITHYKCTISCLTQRVLRRSNCFDSTNRTKLNKERYVLLPGSQIF